MVSNETDYNPDADLTHDGTVNVLDAIILGNHFGENLLQFWLNPDGMQTLSAGTSIDVSPNALTVFRGETFSITIQLSDAFDLYGWEFKLYWNSTVLNCTGAQLNIPVEWVNSNQEYGTDLAHGFNTTHGRYWKVLSASNPAPSFNGSMSIATFTFKALNSGNTDLMLEETKLGDSAGEPIEHTVSNGYVDVYYGRYMRSDTQTINGLNAYVLNATRASTQLSSSNAVQGRKTVYWGVRAWIRHSSGSEVEIPLDGVTGTPKAVVSRSSGSGIQAGTASISATSLQPTDSVIIRVYMKLGTGSWGLCVAFTTEQLQATTLNSATWTIYYYTYAYYSRVDDMTLGTFYWGTSTRDSRIQNLQYT